MSVGASFITGQYYPSGSLVHRADPRVKLLIVVTFALAVFLVKNFTGFAAIVVLLGFFIYLSRLPAILTLKGVRPLFFILAFTLLIHLGTRDGLRTGLFVDLRLIILVVGASFLTLTSTPVELTDAIESLLSPLKRIGIPSHELAMMMTIALRFIPTLSVEANKIIKAQTARGARFDSKNPLTRARSFTPILVPLFVNVFRRADELAEAMEARAYHGGDGRTRMRELKMRPGDWVGFVMAIILLAGMVWVGRMPIF